MTHAEPLLTVGIRFGALDGYNMLSAEPATQSVVKCELFVVECHSPIQKTIGDMKCRVDVATMPVY